MLPLTPDVDDSPFVPAQIFFPLADSGAIAPLRHFGFEDSFARCIVPLSVFALTVTLYSSL